MPLKNGKIEIKKFREMLRRYEDFVKNEGHEPNIIYIEQGKSDHVSLETFKDMLRRYDRFKKETGREPALIYLDPLGRSGDYVNLATFKDMLRRYDRFKADKGREPSYVMIESTRPLPRLNGKWTRRVIQEIGLFLDASELYRLVSEKCKYNYYYNDQFSSEEALRRMTTTGINCTDACQLFEKVFLEMGYETRIEHCKVKCRDGKWYGHYLLNVKGFELKDWVIWDYVSATKTGRPLGKPCCLNGLKHLGWGIVSPKND